MEHSRREFIKTSGLLLGAAGVGAVDPRLLYAAADHTDQRPTLVVLYLRGGADPGAGITHSQT